MFLWRKTKHEIIIPSITQYRAMTFTPIIAKVFESVVLSMCEMKLLTDELQFGFKKGVGCNDAIFALRSTVNY